MSPEWRKIWKVWCHPHATGGTRLSLKTCETCILYSELCVQHSYVLTQFNSWCEIGNHGHWGIVFLELGKLVVAEFLVMGWIIDIIWFLVLLIRLAYTLKVQYSQIPLTISTVPISFAYTCCWGQTKRPVHVHTHRKGALCFPQQCYKST